MAFIKLTIDTDTRDVSITVRTDLDRLALAADTLGLLAHAAEQDVVTGFSFVDAAARRREEAAHAAEQDVVTGFSFVDAAARRREEAARAENLRAARRFHNLLAVDEE